MRAGAPPRSPNEELEQKIDELSGGVLKPAGD